MLGIMWGLISARAALIASVLGSTPATLAKPPSFAASKKKPFPPPTSKIDFLKFFPPSALFTRLKYVFLRPSTSVE